MKKQAEMVVDEVEQLRAEAQRVAEAIEKANAALQTADPEGAQALALSLAKNGLLLPVLRERLVTAEREAAEKRRQEEIAISLAELEQRHAEGQELQRQWEEVSHSIIHLAGEMHRVRVAKQRALDALNHLTGGQYQLRATEPMPYNLDVWLIPRPYLQGFEHWYAQTYEKRNAAYTGPRY